MPMDCRSAAPAAVSVFAMGAAHECDRGSDREAGGEEVIEYQIESAVARVEEGKPRAPNGGEADHERASGKTEKPKRDMPRAWWRDPATIPARSSLYDGHYIRRTIGATIGGGG